MPQTFDNLISPEMAEKVAARTEQLARESSIRAAHRFAAPLIEYVQAGILPEDVFEQMKSKEREKATAELLEDRATGLVNDDCSRGLGFTALIIPAPPYLIEYLEHGLDITDKPMFDTPQIIELDSADEESPIVALQSTKGVYKYNSNTKQISFNKDAEEAGTSFPYVMKSRYDATIHALYVSKIVGNMGELWINPRPTEMITTALFDAQAQAF